MRLHKIWRGWLNASFANRITLFALSLTLGVSLVVGAGSYVALRAQIQSAIQRDLAAQADLSESRLRYFITQARVELETLSRNSFLFNGLVDSAGRDAYLQPFLRDFRLSLPGKDDASLTLYDFGGKPLIRVRSGKDIAPDADQVGQAIATGKLQVQIITQGNETALRLVQPVYLPPTKSVEGALAVSIQLAPLLANTGVDLAEDQALQLQAADAVLAQTGASQQDAIRVARTLKLAAPFDTLRLRLTLDSSTRSLYAPLDRLTLFYGVGLLLLLPSVGWLTHRRSNRLVAPLAQLSATAEAIARSGAITLPLQLEAPNEVGRLAGAFVRMLARLGALQGELKQLNEDLETKVAARTVDLNNQKFALDQHAIVSVADLKGNITYANDLFCKISGYSQAELIGQNHRIVNSGFHPPEVFSELWRTISQGNVWYGELKNRNKAGGYYWVASTIVPLMGADGRPQNYMAIRTDISAVKQAEEEIRQLNVSLERRVLERTTELATANKELESFSYSVSHDLRAPLRTIDGFSQVLLEDYADKLDDQGKDYLKRVRSATQRMGHLIDDMITLSRVTRADMRRETIDLGALAAEVIAELQRSEPERPVDWHIESALVAQGDAGLLRVVLVNLLGNAWKFTGKTANAKIEFGANSVPDADNAEGMTEFFVRDNGAGYDMAYADKLFGAFQRLHLSNDFAGTGIGLATVQRIIHRHGGRVWAEGVVGKGATFYFSL
jgi:PAS domain S-box-containing protein